MSIGADRGHTPDFAEKLRSINWGLIFLLSIIAGIGFMVLYSAANASFDPWASKSMIRYGISLALLLTVALVDIRFWLKAAYPI